MEYEAKPTENTHEIRARTTYKTKEKPKGQQQVGKENNSQEQRQTIQHKGEAIEKAMETKPNP